MSLVGSHTVNETDAGSALIVTDEVNLHLVPYLPENGVYNGDMQVTFQYDNPESGVRWDKASESIVGRFNTVVKWHPKYMNQLNLAINGREYLTGFVKDGYTDFPFTVTYTYTIQTTGAGSGGSGKSRVSASGGTGGIGGTHTATYTNIITVRCNWDVAKYEWKDRYNVQWLGQTEKYYSYRRQ